MTTTNLFLKTNNPIIISSKLNLVLKNIDDFDWKDSICEDVIKEIINRKKVVKEYKFNENISYDYKGVNYMIDNVLMIEIEDLQKSLYKKVNEYMDNPTCEGKTFQAKFIDLYNFIICNTTFKNEFKQITITYDSSPINSQTDYLRLSRYKKFKFKDIKEKYELDKEDTKKIIENLCSFGNSIDLYIKNDDNFFELKYIIDALNEEDQYNTFYIFKIVSIIEMLVKNKKHDKWEEDDYNNLTKYIFDDEYKIKNKYTFVRLIIQIRNKIAHCDTKNLTKKLNDYKKEYMKNYSFDFYEYSEENWIYLSMSIKLNEILANILFSKLVIENNKDT